MASRDRTPAEVVARALRDTLISPNESDSNLEPANVVDAIVKAGRIVGASLDRVAKAIDGLAAVIEKRNDAQT